MKIEVYSKEDCGLCEAAKEKLKLMNLPYEEHDLEYHIAYHEDWREDGSIDVLTARSDLNTIPLFKIDGEFYAYAEAMKVIKKKTAEG